MVENVESRLKKLEKSRASVVEPVEFRVTFVEMRPDGAVWCRNASTGKRKRAVASSVGIEPWSAPESLLAAASKVSIPVVDPIPEVVHVDTQDDEIERVRLQIAADFSGSYGYAMRPGRR